MFKLLLHLIVLYYCLRMQGLLNEDKVNSFYLPIYFPTSKELEVIIERNGCFTIEKMDMLWDPLQNMKFSPQSVVGRLRSVFEGVFKEHFGSEFVDHIFNYFATKLAGILFSFKEMKQHSKVNFFVLLKRKIN